MRVVRRPLSFVVAAMLVAALPSPSGATKYAGEFLKIKAGARAVGMGSAFSAVADDATAPYWNPAGMVYLPYREVLPQHSEQFGNLVNHDYIGAVFPLGGTEVDRSALGLGFIRVAIDDIPVTPRPGQLKAGVDYIDGGQDNDISTDDTGNLNEQWDAGERLLNLDLYSASSSDMALLLSYARQRGKHWAFGGNVKFVRQSIPDTLPGEHVVAYGAGLDFGTLFMATDAVTLSAVVHDLTTTYLAWSNGTREYVMPTLDTGAAFAFKPAERHALTWAIDLAWGFQRRSLDSNAALGGQTWDLRTGLEYWYRQTVALRSGVDGKDLNFGAGVRYKHLGVDYAASLHRMFAGDEADFPGDQDLDATHLVSASFSW